MRGQEIIINNKNTTAVETTRNDMKKQALEKLTEAEEFLLVTSNKNGNGITLSGMSASSIPKFISRLSDWLHSSMRCNKKIKDHLE